MRGETCRGDGEGNSDGDREGKINSGDRDVHEGKKGTTKTESKVEVLGGRGRARGETKRRTGTTCGES